MLCFAYKWLGEKQTHIVALPDFKTWKKNKKDDTELVYKLWELFNEAEIIIAHNGDLFDIKKANARFIQHRLEPPSPYKSIDTLKVARRYFKFDSNKLDRLGQYLEIGRKEKNMDFSVWLGCMEGKTESWVKMRKYNIQDVVLLEKVYFKLRGWIKNSPNMNMLYGTSFNCPNCASEHTTRQGIYTSRTGAYQRWKCQNCGAWSHGENIKSPKPIK